VSRPNGTPAEMTHALPRRTFAVISHPDAGKSTLTEALALHAQVLSEAGAVHGKAGRKATVSDWMQMERDRGISIASAALQFEFGDHIVNMVDTPGHSDFSEDTYRVLSAVDCAVMLIDAAKGLEPQTLKLFRVCRHRGIPVITVVNKWDRPGKDPLELLDEIEQQIGLRPTPLTWPVGIVGDFRGVLERSSGDFVEFTRTAGGATRAPERRVAAGEARLAQGQWWDTAVEEHELLAADGADHDQESFLAGVTTPVLFASALLNFGVGQLLQVLLDVAPAPAPQAGEDGSLRPLEGDFSAFVFKVQSGMDAAHRDRLAYARVCSGVFERGMVVQHADTGRPFTTKYAQAVFGRERASVETAYPGDIVGLVNASALTVGDTIHTGPVIRYPAMARFAPEHFAVVRPKDNGRQKQFRRGMDQLDEEGVVQVLRSDLRGDQAPVLAAVGLMQFEVVQQRLASEFGVQVDLDHLDYTLARSVSEQDAPTVNAARGVEVLRRSDGALLALFPDRWRADTVARNNPGITLTELPAGGL
jgi:peptide chain release factor 3